MNDIFTKSLSFMPSSCKVVKRKAWLNLIKFIDRDAMSRKQSAIILASGNFRIFRKNVLQSNRKHATYPDVLIGSF